MLVCYGFVSFLSYVTVHEKIQSKSGILEIEFNFALNITDTVVYCGEHSIFVSLEMKKL